MIGKTLLHYRIVEWLGQGGMGTVYAARDTKLGRRVAIKILDSQLADNTERLTRFKREAEAVAALSHPNIVTLHSLEESDGTHFLTMELVEGQPLDKVAPRGGMNLGEFMKLAIPLVDALAAAHARGIVHRDLKPSNILVTDAGEPMILDFGLAHFDQEFSRHVSMPPDTPETLTEKRVILGTLAYMSPEQARAEQVDRRSDLFSLGLLFYQMLTGRKAFGRSSAAETFSAILRDQPPPLTEVKPELPEQLEGILNKCLAKRREDRYDSANDLSRRLQALEGDQSTMVLPAAPTDPQPQKRVFKIAALFVALGLLLFFAVRWLTPPKATNSDTLAVLPFKNLSGDSNLDYLAEGISAGLISHLSEFRGLHLVGRSETWALRGRELSVSQIGHDLGVGALVDGEVHMEGERLRVAVSLLDPVSAVVLWTESFHGTRDELLALQEKIAGRLARVLPVSLSFQNRLRLSKDPTRSLKAYDFYLQAQNLLEALDKPRGPDLAIDLFRTAIELDDEFALARVGLSEALWRVYRRDRSSAFLEEAEAEAKKALQIDSQLPAAEVALARVHRESGRYAVSIAELRQALPNHPNPAAAQRELAFSYQQAGLIEDAERCLQLAVILDPNEWTNWNSLGGFLVDIGRYTEAEEAYERSRHTAPENISWPLENLAAVRIYNSDFAGAIEFYTQLDHPVEDSGLASNIATAYFFLEDLGKAEEYYRLAVSLEPQVPMRHGNLADLLLRDGRADEALEEYRRAASLSQEALETNPRNVSLQLETAVYTAKARSCSESLDLAHALTRTLPDTAQNRHNLAIAFALCDQLEAAVAELQRAVQLGFPTELIHQEDEFRTLHELPQYRQAIIGQAGNPQN